MSDERLPHVGAYPDPPPPYDYSEAKQPDYETEKALSTKELFELGCQLVDRVRDNDARAVPGASAVLGLILMELESRFKGGSPRALPAYWCDWP